MYKNYFKLRNFIISNLIGFAFILLIPNFSVADNIHFIHAGPPDGSPKRWASSIASIFSYSDSTNTLNKVWSMDKTGHLSDVRVYSNLNKIIIGYNDRQKYHYANRIAIISGDSIKIENFIEFENDTFITRFKYFSNSDKGFLKVDKNTLNNVANKSSIALNTFKGNESKSLSNLNQNIHLAGIGSMAVGHNADILNIRVNMDGTLTHVDFRDNETITIETNIIPDSLIQLNSSRGWTLIANESDYLVLLSTPYSKDVKVKEILIYKKDIRTWYSMLIEGNATGPKLINNWLVGVIEDTHPDRDWSRKIGPPSVYREEIVMVNIKELNQYIIHLGKNAEFLYIDNDSRVFYRIGKQLFKANLVDGEFIEKQLILDDPMVEGIHWAFSWFNR